MRAYSTDFTEDSLFRPHGRVEWHILEDRRVVYRADGPFNKELFEVLARIEESAFTEYKQRWSVWGCITELHGDCMLTRDAVLFYQSFLHKIKNKGLAPVASAYIFSKCSESGALGRTLYQDIHRFSRFNAANFDEFSAGLAWVKERLQQYQQVSPK